MKRARLRPPGKALTPPLQERVPMTGRLDRTAALFIFLVALSLRLVHLWQLRATPFAAILFGDAQSYDVWAQSIAGGDVLGQRVFYQAPLYPYFLGAVYAIAGHDLAVARVCQALVGSASCVLLGAAAARLFSRTTGIVAGIALAAYAPAIFFDGLIQKSVLDVFLTSLIVWLLSDLVGDGGLDHQRRTWLWLGMALGALSLTRENALVLVAVVFVWILVRVRPPVRSRATAAAIFAAGVLAVLAPVVVRNTAVAGGFHLTTAQFGPNFYIGNNPGSDGTYVPLRPGRGAPEYEQQDATELAERARGRSLSPAEVSSYWTGQALEFITGQPGAWLRLVGRKFLLVWNVNEAVDTESQETYAEFSLVVRLGAAWGHFGLLVPLAFFGVCATWASRDRLWIFYVLTIAYAGSVLVFYVFARYRAPLVPMLMLFASAGIARAADFLREAPTAGRATAIAVTAAAALLANRPLLDSLRMQAVTYTNLGAAFRSQQRLDEAVASHRLALTMVPDYAEAHYNLANALLDQNKIDEAADHFQSALSVLPGSAGAYNTIGISMLAKGRTAEAVSSFEQALDLDPAWVEAHQNLAMALAEQQQFDSAIQHLRRAIELDPQNTNTRYDLGGVLLRQQDFTTAAQELERAIQIAPASPELHNLLGVALGSQGKTREAVAQFERALALRPGFPDAQRNLELALPRKR
jgi:tetratricopeptide (TPR) repeat protein